MIRRGENVSTYELEAMMQSCPFVSDVAVTAEPDDLLGSRIVAHVIPGIGYSADAFRHWCREELGRRGEPDTLAEHRHFPRTETGRVIARALGRKASGA